MDINKICSCIDHTVLSPYATENDIINGCRLAVKYNAASVCIPPCYVKTAYNKVGSCIPVSTVIGFPNGYDTISSKVFQAKQAIEDGASEIDMVVNISKLKSGDFAYIEKELEEVRAACQSTVLKVIIETCYLTDFEKKQMCHMISNTGADFIKTSTGFGTKGATKEDIAFFASVCSPFIKIKASGGISTFQDANELLILGAHRIGASKLLPALEEGKVKA